MAVKSRSTSLPLLTFQSEETEIGEAFDDQDTIRTILNKMPEPAGSGEGLFPTGNGEDEKSSSEPDSLQDPRHARYLGKYLAMRSAREILARQADSNNRGDNNSAADQDDASVSTNNDKSVMNGGNGGDAAIGRFSYDERASRPRTSRAREVAEAATCSTL